MAAIRLEHITKVYPATRFTLRGREETRGSDDDAAPRPIVAVDDLSLSVADGTTTVIVGPSGCGKSTLLRIIAGLTDFTGNVYYNDTRVNDTPPGDRRIGMVFQNYALYPHFLGHGNLSFFFNVQKRPPEEAEERIRVTSEIMGIGFKELLRRKPRTLSGGQQQRVAIARAIVRQPELFLFDEPLASLDAELRARTRVEIKRLLRRFHITAIYVTHDQTEAVALGDAIAVMRAGRIEQVGPYPQLIQRPANAFVAGFLGLPPMNLLPGAVEEGRWRAGELRVPLPPALRAATHTGQAVTLGIRPEAALVAADGERPDGVPPDGVRLSGVIEVVEPDFARQRQWVYLRSGELVYCVVTPLEARIAQGYPLDVLFPHSALHFFDTQSEARLV